MLPSLSSSPSEPVVRATTAPLPGSFAAFFARASAALRREHGQAWGKHVHALRGLCVVLHIGDEVIPLRFSAVGVALMPDDGGAHVVLSADHAMIFALVDGEVTIEAAVRQNRLRLRGTPAHLVRFHEGLMLWLHGAVRCPSFPQILADTRDIGWETPCL